MKKETIFEYFKNHSEIKNRSETTLKKYAFQIERLFDEIDTEKIGKDFAAAIQNDDAGKSIKILADYYRNRADVSVKNFQPPKTFNQTVADNAVCGRVTVVNREYCFENGRIDFLFDPTAAEPPQNHEWLWQLNRMEFWHDMAGAYNVLKDDKYADAFNEQMLNWIEQTEINNPWNAPGCAWRTIECGLRLMGVWQTAFETFRKSEKVFDETLLLISASMFIQAEHLIMHPTCGNWLMMESNGVYAFSSVFPEFKKSTQLRKTAAERLFEAVNAQILPDGMHNELSPDYQFVVFKCATDLLSVARAMGYDSEIPENFTELTEKTAKAAIKLSTPAFTQPRTNDTYTIPTKRFTGIAEQTLSNDGEFVFVNSDRQKGNEPNGGKASAILPNAGFCVMRSDWGKEATYLCFDVGPLGMGHMHQDKLNIILYKGEQELIFDDGGGHYESSRAREYGTSGYGHNTALVDRLAQNRTEPKQYETAVDAGWKSDEKTDYAFGIYDGEFGPEKTKPATHKREVTFYKPDFYKITDTLTSADGNTHDYEILFQTDTVNVKPLDEYGGGAIADFGAEYDLCIIPLITEDAELEIVSGQTEPGYRGWFVGRNDLTLHKATTISYKSENRKNAKFETLLIPIKHRDKIPIPKKTDTGYSITVNGKEYLI